MSLRNFMAIIGSAENASEHPLGAAVVKRAKEVSLLVWTFAVLCGVSELPHGCGLER